MQIFDRKYLFFFYLELAEKEAIVNIAATQLEKYKVYLMLSKFNQGFRDKVQDF